MTRRALLLLAGLALAVRLLYALLALRGYTPTTDALHYDMLATAVAEGRGLVHPFPTGVDHPTAFRPPLWPLLLGGVYAVTGHSLLAAQVLTAVLGAAAVVGVALLAGRLAGPTVGRVAGLVAALHPVLVSGDAPPLSEPLGAVLLVGLLLAVADRRPALAGLLTGGLLLTRPSAQAAVLVLGVALLVLWGWRRTAVVVAVAAAAVAPWVVRNAVQLGSPVLATSTGFNIAATYSPLALEEGHFVDPVFDERFAPLRARVDVPAGAPPGAGEALLVEEFRAGGLRGLREAPLAPVQVALGNLPRLLALPSDGAAAEADVRDGRAEAVQTLVHVPGLALLAVGVAGLVVLGRRAGRQAAPLLLVAASVPVASLLTVAAPRLRQPLDLLACVGVGVVVAALLARRHARLEARDVDLEPYDDPQPADLRAAPLPR
jgi:hypothetical protein